MERSGDSQALILELVEGEDLSARLKRGPLPLDEALEVCKQIAEALEAAHEKGIIHRDLKPANVKLTTEGKVKALDFGLAKTSAAEDASLSPTDLQSPTITADYTLPGTLLGTAGYMSPEQARGKAVDKRSDIWSFGVVLFECLTGDRLFSGETVTDSIGALLHKEVDWSLLPPNTPPAVLLLLRKCLSRDRKKRLRDIGDATVDLEQAIADPKSSMTHSFGAAPPEGGKRNRAPFVWIAGVGVLLILATAAITWVLKPIPKPAVARRLSVELDSSNLLSSEYGTAVQISPDETTLVFIAYSRETGKRILMKRRLDELIAEEIPGTENVNCFCFSPDGQWICFGEFTIGGGGSLKKVSVTAGKPQELCEAHMIRGINWGDDDQIVFARSTLDKIYRVSAFGGAPAEPATELREKEITHRWPQVLPGSKAVLYTANARQSRYDEASIMVQPADGGEAKALHRGGFHGRYLSSGHLVYLSQDTLFAAPFDLANLSVQGQPVPILNGVASNDRGGAHFDVSRSGTLVYLPGGSEEQLYELEWVDLEGKRETLLPADRYGVFKFSPDGKFLAYDLFDGQQRDIWIYDFELKAKRKIVFGPGDQISPVWSPDSKTIVFQSISQDNQNSICWKRVDTSDEGQLIVSSEEDRLRPWAWAGKLLAINKTPSGELPRLKVLTLEGDDQSGWTSPQERQDLLQTPSLQWSSDISPNGRWVAYASNETGQFEIYTLEIPDGGSRKQISFEGLNSVFPVWDRTNQTLLFETELKDMDATVRQVFIAPYQIQGQTIKFDKPMAWPEGTYSYHFGLSGFDLHPDGQRLLVRKRVSAFRDHFVLNENFLDHLKEKAPIGEN